MRRLLTFECEGELLAGTLDQAEGEVGVLIVTGGSQTRIGSHRIFERLSKHLSDNGFSCLRFDRRGVGDSSGEDPGFKGSEADLSAAARTLGSEAPQLKRVVGFGLCDGATALALFGQAAGLDGVILTNPWLVEAEAGEPAPAALQAHYRKRLTSAAAWKRLLTGGVSLGNLGSGLKKAAAGQAPSPLAEQSAAALAAASGRAAVILASGDNTAIAARAELKSPMFEVSVVATSEIDTDSHTFARPGDEQALAEAVLIVLRELQASG
jgi:exosortase A-associated hydrolase 1